MRYFLATARPLIEDLAGTLVFYLLYLASGSTALAAGVGLAIGFAQVAWHLWRHGTVPVVLLLGVALTTVFAALSLLADDPRVLLLKPSIIYAVVGTGMLPRGWVARYVPSVARAVLAPRTLDRVGWGWAALMFATALANLAAVATLAPRTAALAFVVGALASKLALFLGQYLLLRARVARSYRARGLF